MMEKQYRVEIPEETVRALGIPEKDINSIIRRELAVYLFEKGKLSFGQARRLSGLSIWDFMELLRKMEVPLRYGIAEFEEDLKIIKEV